MLEHLERTTGECLALARAVRSTLTEAANRFVDKVRVTALGGAGSDFPSERIGSLPGWTNHDIQCGGHILMRFPRNRADSLGVVVEPPLSAATSA